jgi:hypothetical protein
MADAASHQAHKDLSATGIGKLNVLNHQWLVKLLEHSRTHFHWTSSFPTF